MAVKEYVDVFELQWQNNIEYTDVFEINFDGKKEYIDVFEFIWESVMPILCDPKYINKNIEGELVVFDPMDVNYSTNLPVLPENHRKPLVKSGTIVPAFSESPYRYLRIEDTDAGDKVYYSRS